MVMTRFIQVFAFTLVTPCCLSSVGCSSSNDPVGGGTAGTGNTGTAGTVAVAGGTGGTASAAGGSTAIAGSSNTTGGATAAGGTGGVGFQPLCAGLTTAAGPAP